MRAFVLDEVGDVEALAPLQEDSDRLEQSPTALLCGLASLPDWQLLEGDGKLEGRVAVASVRLFIFHVRRKQTVCALISCPLEKVRDQHGTQPSGDAEGCQWRASGNMKSGFHTITRSR